MVDYEQPPCSSPQHSQTASSQLKDGSLAQLGQLMDAAQKPRSRWRPGAARASQTVAMSMRVPGGAVAVGAHVRQVTNIDSGSGPKCS